MYVFLVEPYDFHFVWVFGFLLFCLIYVVVPVMIIFPRKFLQFWYRILPLIYHRSLSNNWSLKFFIWATYLRASSKRLNSFLTKHLLGKPIDLICAIHYFLYLFVSCFSNNKLFLRLFQTNLAGAVELLDVFFCRSHSKAVSFIVVSRNKTVTFRDFRNRSLRKLIGLL